MRYLYNTMLPYNVRAAIHSSQIQSKSKLHWALKIVAIITVIGLVIFALYKHFTPDYVEDFDTDSADFTNEDDFADE